MWPLSLTVDTITETETFCTLASRGQIVRYILFHLFREEQWTRTWERLWNYESAWLLTAVFIRILMTYIIHSDTAFWNHILKFVRVLCETSWNEDVTIIVIGQIFLPIGSYSGVLWIISDCISGICQILDLMDYIRNKCAY